MAFAALLGALLSSCQPQPKLPPIHLSVWRGELALKAYTSPEDSLRLRAFFYDCLYEGDTTVPDSIYLQDLATFRQDSLFQWLIDTTLRLYPPDYPFAERLRPLFQRWLYHFPQDTIPQIVTMVTGYGPIGALTLERDMVQLCTTHLMLGLNYFLSDTFGFYPPDLPYFIRRRLTPPHIPVFVALRLIRSKMPTLSPRSIPKMIDYMIWYGIQLYALEQLLPDLPDTLRFFYTANHLAWLAENKRYAYKLLLSQLYNSKYSDIQPFIGEEPFTKALGRDSPPRLGWYFGYEIVRQYMRKHKDLSLAKLLALPPSEYQMLFEKANYHP